MSTSISFSAPGKAVIWGEYAVLAGAPALVMALDRRASCTITPGGEHWEIRGLGYRGETRVSRAALETGDVAAGSVARPLAAAARALRVSLPDGAHVELDTQPFYTTDPTPRKLGIGSSAAICTAVCAAVAELTGTELQLEQALAAHRWLQNARGSGLDVAAAFAGGLIRFQASASSPATWPEGLHYQYVWTGESASTADHIQTFASWRAGGDTAPLDALCAASVSLFANADMANLARYATCLKNLDRNAHLGIYSAPHIQLDKLAKSHQVVYKPCGAGGGDIGIALSMDSGALKAFTNAAAERAFTPLSMESADNGIKPTS